MMSVMQSEVFEAFRAIDIPEDKAMKAATVLSKRDEDVISIKSELLLIVPPFWSRPPASSRKWASALDFTTFGERCPDADLGTDFDLYPSLSFR